MTERWSVLSAWHNQWLEADADTRAELRRQLGTDQPDLLDEADSLAAASVGLPGFLETSAFVLAARDLADESPLLAVDTMVGPYRIASLLAHGGMGDVYVATDVRLKRDVALKVLSGADAGDSQRVDRFLQEARVTASLDHPNVVRLFDVGLFDGRPYFVTELLDGETLRTRIERGRLPTEIARRIAAEIADGLMAAHAAQLVHRDLKPENIFLTRAGPSKILDFGIAKLAQDTVGRARLSTLTGVLLGTAGYLAPEQVIGDAVDSRADLFALGSILFEMVSGRRAFARGNTVDTLHAIVHDPPPILLIEAASVPPALVAIVMRLLEKAPGDRFQTSADLAWALAHSGKESADALPRPTSGSRPAPRRRLRRPLWIAVATVCAAVAYVGWRDTRPRPAEEPWLTRFTWALPTGVILNSAPATSPDGRTVIFAGLEGSNSRLFTRRLDSLETTAIAGTDGAKQPFWSPDGASVGFFAHGKLMKIVVAGGAPVEIADAPDGRGGAWSRLDEIVFAPDLTEAALSRVSAGGGKVEAVTRLDVAHGENSHRWPVFLPDGMHFLYFVRSTDDARRGVYLGRSDQPSAISGKLLIRAESGAVFAPPRAPDDPGILLYVMNGQIEAQRFDAAHLALVGNARMVGVAAGGNTLYEAAMVSASRDVIAFAAAPIPYGVRLASVERTGGGYEVSQEREAQNNPRLSPDGNRLARQRIDPLGGNPDIWVDDLTRHTRVRVTTAPDRDALPVWSPDGRQLAHLSGRFATREISITAADGTGVVRVLPCPQQFCEPTDWSPDGTALLVNVRGGDVWTVPLDSAKAAHPVLAEAFVERDARFSRDGGWVAYVSNESGRPEVSVRNLSGVPRRIVISADGGDQPVWRRDGTELFFVDPSGHLRSVAVRTGADASLTFGPAVQVNIPAIGSGHGSTQYDVSPDGARVYFLRHDEEQASDSVGVITGWHALLH